MPREDKTKICEDYDEVKCMLNASRYWMNHKTSETISIKPCDCLTACRSITYMPSFEKETPLEDLVTDQPVPLLEK